MKLLTPWEWPAHSTSSRGLVGVEVVAEVEVVVEAVGVAALKKKNIYILKKVVKVGNTKYRRPTFDAQK
jgi:hypothetical protein